MSVQDETCFDTKFYIGSVSHRRIKPVSHRFRYKIFSMLINIDELKSLDHHFRSFGYNRPALMGFYDADHGPKDGTPLKPWITQQLQEGGYDFNVGTIRLLCFPRLMGMVFNPLSVWYCYDTEEKLRTILYEVRNTFGQWRGYLLPVDQDRSAGSVIRQACDKTFYVSPLMDMEHRYHFTLTEPGDKISLGIRETKDNERVLLAVQTGTAKAVTAKSIRSVFWSHPLMFLKIVGAIHFEAIRTILKGAKFHVNPQSGSDNVTFPDKPHS